MYHKGVKVVKRREKLPWFTTLGMFSMVIFLTINIISSVIGGFMWSPLVLMKLSIKMTWMSSMKLGLSNANNFKMKQ